MRLPRQLDQRLSPSAYRRLTFAALVLLYLIVVTGALVRLTGSGLGCSDWPECNERNFVDVSSKHAAIEQINRLITGAVGIAVIIAVLGAVARRPRRRDLTWLAIGEVLGVIAQAVLGAFVVWSHLNPVLVQGHFLLSMLLIADALVLHRRAGSDDRRWAAGRPRLAWVAAAAGSLAVLSGTVVTGAGPHAGSHEGDVIERLPLAPVTAVRLHSVSVLVTLAVAVALGWQARRRGNARLERAVEWFVLAGVAQASIGYIQYFSDLPVALVALHVAGATAICLALVNLVLVAGDWSEHDAPTPPRAPVPA